MWAPGLPCSPGHFSQALHLCKSGVPLWAWPPPELGEHRGQDRPPDCSSRGQILGEVWWPDQINPHGQPQGPQWRGACIHLQVRNRGHLPRPQGCRQSPGRPDPKHCIRLAPRLCVGREPSWEGQLGQAVRAAPPTPLASLGLYSTWLWSQIHLNAITVAFLACPQPGCPGPDEGALGRQPSCTGLGAEGCGLAQVPFRAMHLTS